MNSDSLAFTQTFYIEFGLNVKQVSKTHGIDANFLVTMSLTWFAIYILLRESIGMANKHFKRYCRFDVSKIFAVFYNLLLLIPNT